MGKIITLETVMEEKKKMQLEFQKLCQPLNEWLQKNYNPHTRIIIENDHAEITESVICVPFEVLD
jgi:hypothetical protein